MSLAKVNNFHSHGWCQWADTNFRIGELMLYLTERELRFVAQHEEFGMGIRLVAEALLDDELDINGKLKALYYHSRIVENKEPLLIKEEEYIKFSEKLRLTKEKEFLKIYNAPEIKSSEQTFYLTQGKSGEI